MPNLQDEKTKSDLDVEKLKYPRTERSFFLWREKPKGTGELAAIIIPLDDRALKSYNTYREVLLEIFGSTIDSKGTIDFKIQELDS